MIKFENVNVTYPGGVVALKDINLEIKEGDFIIIVGLSGAGKSTLLRTINNLVKPSSGTVYLEGADVTNAKKKELKLIRSKIGMIFQTFNLVNRSTVLKNVLTGRLSNVSTIKSILGLWPKDEKKLAFEALNQVEILEKAYVRASNLSGGQQQRVGIARALSQKPKVMLADEPVASLDPITSRVVMSYLKKINTEFKEYIEKSCGLHNVEVIAFENPGTHSLTEAYNIILEKSTNDIVVLCHDDIYFEKSNWGNKVLKH
ncbi:MAG: phosphonate ABC transporter ATP-binding protein, partial [Proteobacteria bacterium]|nr:phosphonate ABC transporter ATP-binding protein [Pseudomonadota bacterium]